MRYHRSLISQPPKGLVSHWRFDGNVLDSVGTNDGTINGDPQFVSGVSGQALSFDGADDYVEIGDKANLNFDGTDSFTWAMRIKPTDYTDVGNGYVWLQHERSYFIQRASKGMELGCNISGSETMFGVTPNIGEWTHIAFTYSSGQLELFLNGANVNSA